DELAPPALGEDLLVGGHAAGQRVAADVGEQHREAVGRPALRDRPADPGGRPGDDGAAGHQRIVAPVLSRSPAAPSRSYPVSPGSRTPRPPPPRGTPGRPPGAPGLPPAVAPPTSRTPAPRPPSPRPAGPAASSPAGSPASPSGRATIWRPPVLPLCRR